MTSSNSKIICSEAARQTIQRIQEMARLEVLGKAKWLKPTQKQVMRDKLLSRAWRHNQLVSAMVHVMWSALPILSIVFPKKARPSQARDMA